MRLPPSISVIITGSVGIAVLRDDEGQVHAVPVMLAPGFWAKMKERANGQGKGNQ
jgi:hypothetical protein